MAGLFSKTTARRDFVKRRGGLFQVEANEGGHDLFA